MNNNDTFLQSVPQGNDGASCIVIHPGSQYLRIGRPLDSAPISVLHAIAYKRKSRNHIHTDYLLTPQTKLDRALTQELESCRLKISHILQSSHTSNGDKRFATPPQQISAFNKRSAPVSDKVERQSDINSEPPIEFGDTVIGDQILKLGSNHEYNIHFPYRAGDLNIRSSLGGTVTSVLSQLQSIWGHCIKHYFKISLTDLKNYKAVLIIPDIYNRDHVKKLTELILTHLGFGSCFVIQDHVAATFGAGLGAGCVVDVGAEKISVSCVEDAMSYPPSRIRLNYGGSDVSQAFSWLLKKIAFPHQMDTASSQDALALEKLKKDFCTLDLDVCGAQEKEFTFQRHGEPSLKYRVQLGDELLIAPLSFFYPELLKITGSKTAFYQKPNTGDSEDPFDENYLKEITRIRGRGETAENLDPMGIIDVGGDGQDEDIVVDESPSQTPSHTQSSSTHRGEPPSFSFEKLMSIDQVIMASIDKCPNEEVKRRMYSTILVVGGGAKFHGFGKWLQEKLWPQIPFYNRPEQLEVVTRPKDLDPSTTVWKGASLMTCLEGSVELWIKKAEWDKHGVKIIREKCPFIW